MARSNENFTFTVCLRGAHTLDDLRNFKLRNFKLMQFLKKKVKCLNNRVLETRVEFFLAGMKA